MLLDLEQLVTKYDLSIRGIIHIGAHIGQEDKVYEKLGITNVIFFEPQPDVFDKLVKNVRPTSECINHALGNKVGIVRMNVEKFNEGQSSSILTPKLHLTQYPSIKFESTIGVTINTLDNVFLDEDVVELPELNFINIDVQGYELEVFKGGSKMLNSIDYIMTEVNRDEVYEGCARVEQIDEFLGTYGFKRVETTWDGGTWGDAFYIKSK